MSNGARHAIGVVVGLILTPLVGVCLTYGSARTISYYRYFVNHGNDRWIGAALILAAAVMVGFAVGSRLSPLASLLPGMAFTAVGVLWVAAPHWTSENSIGKLPKD